ncbi:MAG: ribonuclease HI family protein [Candidatus Krumholzibacteria bacterium]|nr:ribonuclease HI family protein [Candidatus Krumholzibacteria bacterium]
MKRIKALLKSLAKGTNLDESWKPSGYSSKTEASEALESLADSLEIKPSVGGGGARAGSAKAKLHAVEHAILHVDGASRGNPGPSSIGVIIYLASGEELYSTGKRIGRATNNVAEYRAVIEGLKIARELGVRAVTVRLDSELVVKQLTGIYRIKNVELESLAREVGAHSRHFSRCSFEHVARENNREADRLANKALNSVVDS